VHLLGPGRGQKGALPVPDKGLESKADVIAQGWPSWNRLLACAGIICLMVTVTCRGRAIVWRQEQRSGGLVRSGSGLDLLAA
jgi:hypothetical protein